VLRYRFRLVDTTDPVQVDFFEDLMTKSHNGDETIDIVKQETSFTKDGAYMIAIHWLEDSADEDKKESLRTMLREKI
jgi:hypothetical protein